MPTSHSARWETHTNDPMNPAKRRPVAPALLLLLALAAITAPRASAQLMVKMKLKKTSYVAYEPMSASVTVYNRAGQDIVLGGPNGRSWLSFDVYKDGQLLSPREGGTGLRTFVLGAGKSITKSVDLNRVYPVADYGAYTISAAVYFPPLRNYFSSAKARIQVFDSKPFWRQSVGVSQGAARLASFREYSLFEHRDGTSADVYVRLRDVRGARVYCTFSLGRYINVRRPQATIDTQNRLHVLHLSDPTLYTHSKIGSDGSFLGREFYKESERSRPTLVMDPGGVVRVVGGLPYDPEKAATATAAAKKPRMATERPPGLP